MGCIYFLVAMGIPRVFMFFIWLLTDWFSLAYETVFWPVLGFLFLPYTTLAYMAAMLHNDHSVSGGWLVLLVLAVLADVGQLSGSGRATVRVRTRRRHGG